MAQQPADERTGGIGGIGGIRVRPVLRRRAALIVATTVLVTGGALAYTLTQQPTYTAHARVLVQPLVVPDGPDHVPDMGTEQAIALSGEVLGSAGTTLHRAMSDVESALDVEVAPNANILDIGFSATDRTEARDGASAVATAYMAYRATVGTAGATARSLSTPAVATRLITPAVRPATPSSPDLIVNLLAGIVVGLIAGVGLAFVADRFGQRLRSLTAWQETVGVPVLVGLPREALTDGAGAAAAGDRVAMVQSCLRARVARSLPSGGVLLVTEVREQRERTAVARALANGLADTGWSATLIEMTQDTARSSDVVDRTGARSGHLRVRVSVTAGFGIALRAAGDWYPTTVDSLLRLIEWHQSQHDVVVVTGPPVTTSITTLDVAASADAALLLDDVGSARRRDALRVVAELRAAGCEVTGAVLLGVSRPRVGDARAVRQRPVTPRRPTPARAHRRATADVGALAGVGAAGPDGRAPIDWARAGGEHPRPRPLPSAERPAEALPPAAADRRSTDSTHGAHDTADAAATRVHTSRHTAPEPDAVDAIDTTLTDPTDPAGGALDASLDDLLGRSSEPTINIANGRAR